MDANWHGTLFVLTLYGSQGNEGEDFKEQQPTVRTKKGEWIELEDNCAGRGP